MSNPKVVSVEPEEYQSLVLAFINWEHRRFVVSPYLDKRIFRELRDPTYVRYVPTVSGDAT